MDVSFSLNPVKKYDEATSMYWGYLSEFPQITAVANSEKELDLHLWEVFITMLENEKEVFKQLLSQVKINGNQSHQPA